MSGRQLLTVSDVQTWQRVNSASHADAEAHALEVMIDAVLRDAVAHMSWGLQAACGHVWSTRGKHVPHTHRKAVREALEAIGWVREDSEAAE